MAYNIKGSSIVFIIADTMAISMVAMATISRVPASSTNEMP